MLARTPHQNFSIGTLAIPKRAKAWHDEAPCGFADGPNKYRYAGNDPINFRDPTGLSAAGNPLSTLASGISNVVATALRVTDPLLGAFYEAGSQLPIAAFTIEPGRPNYNPGAEFKAGVVSSDGSSLLLKGKGFKDAHGVVQKSIPLVDGNVDFSKFAHESVEAAIVGDNTFDQGQSKELLAAKIGEKAALDALDQGLTFHHDPHGTRVVTVEGRKVLISNMQLVPRELNETVQHAGSASEARKLISSQRLSISNAKELVKTINKSTIHQIKFGGATARSLGILGVYTDLRDVARVAGIIHPEYQVGRKETAFFLERDNSTFILKRPGLIAGLFVSPYKEYIAGPKTGQSVKVTAEQSASLAQEYYRVQGRYVPGGIFREPRFIPGTERTAIPLTNSRGTKQIGYIDEQGVHESPEYYDFLPEVI